MKTPVKLLREFVKVTLMETNLPEKKNVEKMRHLMNEMLKLQQEMELVYEMMTDEEQNVMGDGLTRIEDGLQELGYGLATFSE